MRGRACQALPILDHVKTCKSFLLFVLRRLPDCCTWNVRYGYYNKKLLEMRGLQWRFHPHACPESARVYPYGYDAVACQSWIRNEIHEDWLNSHALTLDYIEREQSEWHRDLGDSRSFEDRLMGPPDVSSC